MNLSILDLIEGSCGYSIGAFSNFIFSKILQITVFDEQRGLFFHSNVIKGRTTERLSDVPRI